MSVENTSGERTEPLDLDEDTLDKIAMTPAAVEVRSRMAREWAERTGPSRLPWTVRQHFDADVPKLVETVLRLAREKGAALDDAAAVRDAAEGVLADALVEGVERLALERERDEARAELADADRRRFEFEERTSAQVEDLRAEIERLTCAEGGIRDAAIAYVRAAEGDPELVEGGLYRDLRAAVDHWTAVTARLERNEEGETK